MTSTLFFLLAVVGIVLIMIEVFMPGAILGVIGGIFLFLAAIIAFPVFGPLGGLWATLSLILVSGLIFLLWLWLFPSTRIGQAITLQEQTSGKATETREALVGEEGVALSALRPAGVAELLGTREDVWAESGWVDEGSKIKVIRVVASRIIVREIPS